ncbi:MAG: hypothetical protein ACXAD7_15895 [Candidatus Kariarchaeaceae archaeon]|jgi:DNA-binding transcriptional MerR regulator
MSAPSDGNTFSRTIKLIVANLDKTKERIQERFLQVDERLDDLSNSINAINQKLKKNDAGSAAENQIQALTKRIQSLEEKIKDLETAPAGAVAKSTEPVDKAVSTPITPSPKPTAQEMKKAGRVIPPPPSSKRPAAMKTETITEAPKATASVPKAASMVGQKTIPPPPGGKIPAAPSKTTTPPPGEKTDKIPAPQPKSGIPSAPPPQAKPSTSAPVPKGAPSPSTTPGAAPTAAVSTKLPKKKPPISIKDKKSEREQLLEALKQLDGI